MEILCNFADFMESKDVPVGFFLVGKEFLPHGFLILVLVQFPEINVFAWYEKMYVIF